MIRLSLNERARLAALAADRSRRAVLSRVLGSPLLRWRYGTAVADQLLIVPQNLRTADPSFWREVEAGQFGLAGSIAHIGGGSPFAIRPPTDGWARALHGFGWLRHLEAVDTPAARALAHALAVEWSQTYLEGRGIAWEPVVAGRRLISWLTHANTLLPDADQRAYDIIAESMGRQLVRLAAGWRDGAPGYPRLLALNALVLADLCVAGHDRQLEAAERAFGDEIARQILPDGGHVSRNPAVLVELILDFLPLRQCFATRGRPDPPELAAATGRMLKMLRYLRLGDGRLARFNGMGVAQPTPLATALAYDDFEGPTAIATRDSGYVRLERGGVIVIADVGPPPLLELSGEAHAGALSFELSLGTDLVLVNGGAPSAADADWRPASRATASHNTLVLEEQSSSRLVRHAGLEALAGAPPIRGPETVRVSVEDVAGAAASLEASHDGYLERAGVIHTRRLVLSRDGARIDGVDRLAGPSGTLRLRRDRPFAIHFHLHPQVRCIAADPRAATVALPGGGTATLSTEGAVVSIEESVFFADSAGPRQSQQIVLRGATPGESTVAWHIDLRPGGDAGPGRRTVGRDGSTEGGQHG